MDDFIVDCKVSKPVLNCKILAYWMVSPTLAGLSITMSPDELVTFVPFTVKLLTFMLLILLPLVFMYMAGYLLLCLQR